MAINTHKYLLTVCRFQSINCRFVEDSTAFYKVTSQTNTSLKISLTVLAVVTANHHSTSINLVIIYQNMSLVKIHMANDFD